MVIRVSDKKKNYSKVTKLLVKPKFFLNEPSEDCISEYTWEDVLNGVNDAVVYKHLKKCDPVMQKIIVMLKNKYCVREIAEDLHMTTNAVYKRIEKFSKKCKKRG